MFLRGVNDVTLVVGTLKLWRARRPDELDEIALHVPIGHRLAGVGGGGGRDQGE